MRSTLVAAILALSTTARAQAPEISQQAVEAPPHARVGLVVTTGLEAVLPTDVIAPVRFGLRAGAGLRVGLLSPEGDDTNVTLPALAIAGGIAGQTTPGDMVASGFVEARVELLVVPPVRRPLLQPAAVVYALGGLTFREGTVVPHFGLGVGWGILFFAQQELDRGFSGWRFDNQAAPFIAIAAALAAAGRIEVRYVPATGAIPASTSALVGFGF